MSAATVTVFSTVFSATVGRELLENIQGLIVMQAGQTSGFNNIPLYSRGMQSRNVRLLTGKIPDSRCHRERLGFTI